MYLYTRKISPKKSILPAIVVKMKEFCQENTKKKNISYFLISKKPDFNYFPSENLGQCENINFDSYM